jgi:hypothetical protein
MQQYFDYSAPPLPPPPPSEDKEEDEEKGKRTILPPLSPTSKSELHLATF